MADITVGPAVFFSGTVHFAAQTDLGRAVMAERFGWATVGIEFKKSVAGHWIDWFKAQGCDVISLPPAAAGGEA